MGRVILVGDRGTASEKLLGEMEGLGLGYIMGVRMRQLKAAEAVLARAGRYREVARCGDCGKVFTESFPGIGKWARRTDWAEAALLDELGYSSFCGVTRCLGVGYKGLVRALFRRVTGSVDLALALGGLGRVVLGIDEHSFRGNDMMLSVTCVWPVRKVLAILRDDRAETLERFLRQLPSEVQAKIIGVCIDMRVSPAGRAERDQGAAPALAAGEERVRPDRQAAGPVGRHPPAA